MKTSKVKQKIHIKKLEDEYQRDKKIKDRQAQLTIGQMYIDFVLYNLRKMILIALFVTNLINGNTDFALQALLPLLNSQ